MSATKQQKQAQRVERLTNLWLTLLQGPPEGLQVDWLIRNIPGYLDHARQDIDSKARMRLERDTLLLIRQGLPLKKIPSRNTQKESSRYKVEHSSYELPHIDFTPAEQRVLAMVGSVISSGELQLLSNNALLKLRAAELVDGMDIDPAEVATWSAATGQEIQQLETFAKLSQAIAGNFQVKFSYSSHAAAVPEQRRFAPWGIVNVHGRRYCVGFDLGREAVRTFRIVNITEVKLLRQPSPQLPPDDVSLTELVAQALRSMRVTVDATVTVGAAPNVAVQEVLAAGGVEPPVSDTASVTLPNIDRRNLVEVALREGGQMVVTSPTDVVAEVARGYKKLIAAHEQVLAEVTSESGQVVDGGASLA
ncbi:helix-turn-helix transcriptional regulator [Corynebacterium choanae]|uniref:WYL domain-containing protein n=1 Tax=Corynebacterium choanae TaxID=1862358 RepID=A0A3G6J716_9CORY|nr:WYL domain-containing protein [Corynebacterium choanae]AZA13563.1 hypothetical protein CCHOA_05815 [Corynebacterium choanae]